MNVTITLTDCSLADAKEIIATITNEDASRKSERGGAFNQKEAAAYCGVTATTFARHATSAGVEGERRGKVVLYSRGDVERARTAIEGARKQPRRDAGKKTSKQTAKRVSRAKYCADGYWETIN